VSYLIFNTKEDAVARADLEGQRMSLPYHVDGGVTRYATYPVETGDSKWALDVTGYQLSVTENLTKKNSFVQPTLPEGQEF
tara:strand:+ start:614 stop:856 length:243 start_codon:yes stop_codon:yes gene_type:complete